MGGDLFLLGLLRGRETVTAGGPASGLPTGMTAVRYIERRRLQASHRSLDGQTGGRSMNSSTLRRNNGLRRVLVPGVFALALAVAASGAELHVSPGGRDTNPGTPEAPLASLAGARDAVRRHAGPGPVTVWFRGGTYFLPEAVRFTAADSGTADAPVVYAAAPGERPVLSGGLRLTLEWKPHRDGIWRATTPAGLELDQLFVNGTRLPMARYPDFDPGVRHFNGYAADALDPVRTARWANPAGGYIHAMHQHEWGDMHWRITGRKADGSLDYEGGWQNNRPSPMHPQYRFVENIREELDAPGEWYHDAAAGVLYCRPPAGVELAGATIDAVRLPHLVEFAGTREDPVRFITLRGFTVTHTARTFMENREPLLRSDWTVYRGGAVVFEGAEDCAIEDCAFEQVGGNAVFVNRYNRRIAVRGCLLRDSGANGVAFVGDPGAVRSPLFNYGQPFDYAKLDRRPGPATEDYPADCLVEDCLIIRSGRFEKQTAPVQISMARRITVRHCSIYEVPRAGINISEGTWGGHVIEGCDVFDTVLETGDHGSFNSWGRDRYWHPSIAEVDRQVAADPALPFLDAVEPITLRHNRWRCDHGWDVDLDDGSSRYVITDNLFLNGGLKLREGYGRVVTNNIIVNNSLHPHCWYAASGDVFAGNIVMGAYRPAGGMPVDRWGGRVDGNLFTTSEGDRQQFAAQGCDANSVVADPLFVDPAGGDFRVREGSPALRLGFRNFAMDAFGVRKLVLRAVARTPRLPEVRIAPDTQSARPAVEQSYPWRGARLRGLVGEEFSAYGVSKASGGVVLVEVPERSAAFQDGLRKGDLIQSVNGVAVRDLADFVKGLGAATQDQAVVLGLRRDQAPVRVPLRGRAEVPRL